jgi:DNA-directed RNA polymerase specialized sigma24 family protein
MSLHAQENKKNAMLPLTEDIAEKHNGNVVDIKDLVQRILSGLSADERYLITSREVLDISYEELAKITQKNEGSLRTQLSRLKENIRKKYGDML